MSKILLVDDDTNILKSMKRTLKRSYNIVTAQGGDEGLEILDTDGPFAVVISDIQMPGMDGITFLTRVKEGYPETVRIVLTGYAHINNAIDAVNSGNVFRFLTKPCSHESLLRAINDGLEQHDLYKNRAELAVVKRLNVAMERFVEAFAATTEARDPYTAGHQRSVSELSITIGKHMGLDTNQMQGLKLAALVHDIGKLYVPAEFLNKPGRLADLEMAIIRTHPAVGYDLLKGIDFPWPIAQTVRQHHERLDGSGYPDGLKGDEIILEARIVSVADVLDAMVSHRPYRPSRGPEEAIRELETNSGIRYDPEVVKVCLKYCDI